MATTQSGHAPAPGGSTNEPAETRPSSDRWWESYAVRYFVGTVVGVVIVLALRKYATLHKTFAAVIPEGDKLTGGDAVIIAALGLAYCYVASAPVLTMHAVRGRANLQTRSCMFWLCMAWAILIAVPLGMFAWFPDRAKGPAIAWFLVASIVLVQIWSLYKASEKDFERLDGFYKDLVAARFTDWRERRDFVDSYRHLREHGNAVTIVLLEIVLGLAVGLMSSVESLLLALGLWLVPASGSWLVASVLEAKFAKRKGAL